MIPLRLITKAGPAINRMALQKRTSVISGPPTNKVSSAEKIALGSLIVVGITAFPAWVLVHVKDYQKKE